jgi:hypothetical protein
MFGKPTAAIAMVAAALVAASCSRPGADPELAPLRAHVAALEQRKTLIEDTNAIERLQGAYGYYLDRGLWDEVANLFADEGTIEVALDGVYVGKRRVREYLYALGGGKQGGDAFWGEGPYENEYVKEGGVWKIKTLHWYQALYVPYAGGWQNQPDPTLGKRVSAKLPPDKPPSVEYKTWPDTYVPPFSFPNPVARYVASEEAR